MDEQITKIIGKDIEQPSHSRCRHSESHYNKNNPDYKQKHIHCGLDR